MRVLERGMANEANAAEMASDACVSRYHFQRVFRDIVGEAPGKLQRRLKLERAAHALRTTTDDITAIAFETGYASLEGFSRAFRRAYNQSPSEFRRLRSLSIELKGASLVHIDAHTLRLTQYTGEESMDLIDRMLENDYRSKRKLLELARGLTREQLDASLFCQIKQVPWADPDRSLRETLTRMMDMGWWVPELFESINWPYDKQGWDPSTATVDDMIAHLDEFHKTYAPFVEHVKANNLWETTWVDQACVPPETFTYAGLIESGIERGIFRRWMVRQLLVQAGIDAWR